MAKPNSKPTKWNEQDTEYVWLAVVHAARNNNLFPAAALAEKLKRPYGSVTGLAMRLRKLRWKYRQWPTAYDATKVQAAIKQAAIQNNDSLIV